MLGNILSLLCHSFTNCGEGKPEANTHNDIQLKELKKLLISLVIRTNVFKKQNAGIFIHSVI